MQNLGEKYWVGESGNAIEVVICKNSTRGYVARMARPLVRAKFRDTPRSNSRPKQKWKTTITYSIKQGF